MRGLGLGAAHTSRDPRGSATHDSPSTSGNDSWANTFGKRGAAHGDCTCACGPSASGESKHDASTEPDRSADANHYQGSGRRDANANSDTTRTGHASEHATAWNAREHASGKSIHAEWTLYTTNGECDTEQFARQYGPNEAESERTFKFADNTAFVRADRSGKSGESGKQWDRTDSDKPLSCGHFERGNAAGDDVTHRSLE